VEPVNPAGCCAVPSTFVATNQTAVAETNHSTFIFSDKTNRSTEQTTITQTDFSTIYTTNFTT
jgi:hypothetical protein